MGWQPPTKIFDMTTLTHAMADMPKEPNKKGMSSWEFWGRVLLIPYVILFFVFVLYPVGYGLWLASNPSSYVKLFDDPIFYRTVINTLIFLIVGINLKMLLALFLSGFFVQTRTWIKWLSLLFILPWAVPSIPTILSMRFMLNPEWGVINTLIFSAPLTLLQSVAMPSIKSVLGKVPFQELKYSKLLPLCLVLPKPWLLCIDRLSAAISP